MRASHIPTLTLSFSYSPPTPLPDALGVLSPSPFIDSAPPTGLDWKKSGDDVTPFCCWTLAAALGVARALPLRWEEADACDACDASDRSCSSAPMAPAASGLLVGTWEPRALRRGVAEARAERRVLLGEDIVQSPQPAVVEVSSVNQVSW